MMFVPGHCGHRWCRLHRQQGIAKSGARALRSCGPRPRAERWFRLPLHGHGQGRNRTRGSEWQTRFQPEATFHPAPISARTAAIRFRWDRRGMSRPAHSAATVSGTRSPAETAFMTRIPTATPRDAPSVDRLGMGRAQGLAHLATSASARNATLKPSICGWCRRPQLKSTTALGRARKEAGMGLFTITTNSALL